MERTAFIAVVIGVFMAVVLGLLSLVGRDNGDSRPDVPLQLRGLIDNRYNGLPMEEKGFAPHGWIRVIEPAPTWNPEGIGVSYPICQRPEWFPYKRFLGPPVLESAVFIDPTGYMFETAEGIRVHRDGWVVTADGRAFRAEEKIDDMRFPRLPTYKGE